MPTLTAPVPDFVPYAATVLPHDLAARDGHLELTWTDGRASRFHWLWLRDNCACERCINPATREQVFEIDSVPEDLRAAAVTLEPDGVVRVVWSGDGHLSRYHPGWLRAHCYSEDGQVERRPPPPEIWDSGFQVPRFAFAPVMRDDGKLLDWLVRLRSTGLTLLDGLSDDVDAVENLVARISFVRQTNFGRMFDVESRPDPNSNAYTALELPLHTDLPTREVAPGLQFLHCLVNETGGGDSIMADGFRIARTLADEAPDLFEILTRIPLPFRNTDKACDYRFHAPVIGLDAQAQLSEIRWGNFLRGPFDVSEAEMPRLYRAYRRFQAMTREPRFQVRFRIAPGSCMVFDNRRVLHARTAFDPARGPRRLRGCYVDREELLSRIRVLERSHGRASDGAGTTI